MVDPTHAFSVVECDLDDDLTIHGYRTARWRPIRIGIFWYATNGPECSTRNWVMRDACAAHCAQRNA